MISSTRFTGFVEDGAMACSPFVPYHSTRVRHMLSDYIKNASTVLNQKDLTLVSQSHYKGYLSDIIVTTLLIPSGDNSARLPVRTQPREIARTNRPRSQCDS